MAWKVLTLFWDAPVVAWVFGAWTGGWLPVLAGCGGADAGGVAFWHKVAGINKRTARRFCCMMVIGTVVEIDYILFR